MWLVVTKQGIERLFLNKPYRIIVGNVGIWHFPNEISKPLSLGTIKNFIGFNINFNNEPIFYQENYEV